MALEDTILVVDDEREVGQATGRLLRSAEHDVVVDTDVDTALWRLRQGKKYSLVISDYNMPEKTGLDFLKAVRADPALAHIKFVLLTGDASEQTVKAAIAAGVDGYLVKPVQAEVFLRKVKELLGK